MCAVVVMAVDIAKVKGKKKRGKYLLVGGCGRHMQWWWLTRVGIGPHTVVVTVDVGMQ